jgi:hypothetical protein
MWMVLSDDEKLRRIESVLSRWLEPEGGTTSHQALMEILATMDSVIGDAAPPDAERRRWEEDRPIEHPPAPAPKKLRSKSRFLG